MAPANKANYKSYEAQARMVRAIVAAHPDVKWNYKEIAACYGSDMSEHALNHRFRLMRAHAVIIREGRNQGFDMKDLESDDKKLPRTQETVDKKNIAKYFGQSTADGIQFQFRSIKKDAETLRKVGANGGDVANCLSLGTGTSCPVTPSKPAPVRSATSRATATGKRNRTKVIKTNSSEDEDNLDEIEDFSEFETSPSKRLRTTTAPTRGRAAGTPSRLATIKADVTIANASAMLQAGESPSEVETPATIMQPVYTTPASIFGDVERKPYIAPEPAYGHGMGFDADDFLAHSYNFDSSFMGESGEI